MKQNKIELEVDFIGGQGPLTKGEAQAISQYIRMQKEKREKKGLSRKLKRAAKKKSRNKTIV